MTATSQPIKSDQYSNCTRQMFLFISSSSDKFEFFTHTAGNFGIVVNFQFPSIYLQFSSLFTQTDASKCEIRNQGAYFRFKHFFIGPVDF